MNLAASSSGMPTASSMALRTSKSAAVQFTWFVNCIAMSGTSISTMAEPQPKIVHAMPLRTPLALLAIVVAPCMFRRGKTGGQAGERHEQQLRNA
jgi:undecaprenyl pyrophosphate phosphatase UppP